MPQIPRDQDFRIDGDSTIENSWAKPLPKPFAKTVHGHHVQVDGKFLQLKDRKRRTVQWYQYTVINDATRIRALQSFPEYNQDGACDPIHVLCG